MSNPLLTVSGVSKRFGGLQALSEVELTEFEVPRDDGAPQFLCRA